VQARADPQAESLSDASGTERGTQTRHVEALRQNAQQREPDQREKRDPENLVPKPCDRHPAATFPAILDSARVRANPAPDCRCRPDGLREGLPGIRAKMPGMLDAFLAGFVGGLTALVVAGTALGLAVNAARKKMRRR
jgi:hypothetical protein